jgi:hypothetical protein
VKTFTLTVKDATRNGGVSTRIAKNPSISAKTNQSSLRAAPKVRIFPDDYDRFSVMPQRGNGLQLRVALRLPWETSRKRNFNRNAVASLSPKKNAPSRRNRVAVEDKIAFFTQGSRSGNPGLEAVAPLGHN